MSKLVKDMIADINAEEGISDSYQLHAMYLKMNSEGEVESTEKVRPIFKVDIDVENEEFLLHITDDKNEVGEITLCDVINAANEKYYGYEVCIALEKEIDDSWIRVDTPLIGFGENSEQRVFFVIANAD